MKMIHQFFLLSLISISSLLYGAQAGTPTHALLAFTIINPQNKSYTLDLEHFFRGSGEPIKQTIFGVRREENVNLYIPRQKSGHAYLYSLIRISQNCVHYLNQNNCLFV